MIGLLRKFIVEALPFDSTKFLNGQGQWTTNGASSSTTATDPRLIVVVKATSETVNNSAVLQSDNELLFATGANKTYLVDLYLRLNGGTTADFKFAWALPAGATWNWAPEGEGGGGGLGYYWAPKDTAQGSQVALSSTTATANGSSNVPQGFHITSIIMCAATTGTATLQWAQNTTTVADSIVLSNSMLRAVTT